MRVSRALAAAAWALALAAAPPAAADCDASVSQVDFGRFDYKDGGDITGQLTVTCDRPTAFEVSASPGYGSYRGRTMLGRDGAVLHYNLYVDASRRRVWGDGEAGGTARIAGKSDGRKAVSYTIYGRIPGGQTVRPGGYRDTVKVSVSR